VGEGHPLERGSRLRVSGQGRRQRLGHFGLPRRLVQLDGHLGLVAGLDADAAADLAVQADQELAAHAGHAGPPGVAVDGRDHREPSGAFPHRRHLGLVEHHRGGWAAALQLRAEPDNSPALSSLTGSAAQAPPGQDARSARPRPHANELRGAPDAV
jgi:hypothetical protein